MLSSFLEKESYMPYSLVGEYKRLRAYGIGSNPVAVFGNSAINYKERKKVMRFLSEDGKLFNTEDECIEHEKSVKKEKEQKEKEAEQAKKAEQAKDLKQIMNLLDEVNKKMEELDEATSGYEKKYGVSFDPFSKKSKVNKTDKADKIDFSVKKDSNTYDDLDKLIKLFVGKV